MGTKAAPDPLSDRKALKIPSRGSLVLARALVADSASVRPSSASTAAGITTAVSGAASAAAEIYVDDVRSVVLSVAEGACVVREPSYDEDEKHHDDRDERARRRIVAATLVDDVISHMSWIEPIMLLPTQPRYERGGECWMKGDYI